MDDERQDAVTRFGREMARVREMAEVTQDRLARQVGVSSSHISNVEKGKRTAKTRLVHDIDQALSANGRLERLWEELRGNSRPAWLDAIADLLRDAVSVLDCQTMFFPGLVQTEDYARSIIRTTSPWMGREEVETSVKSRMQRAERFQSSPTPNMWAVVDEGVITRHIGSNAIMKAQLAHVRGLVEKERITLQVARGEHPGMAGPFKIISSPTAPDVVYAESARSGQMIDAPEHVQRFRYLFGALQAIAMPPGQSVRFMVEEMEGLSNE